MSTINQKFKRRKKSTSSKTDDVAKVEDKSEKEVDYMIKDDEIHTHEIFVWNDFILVGDSLIAYLSENFSSYDTTTHGPKRCLGKDLRIQNLVLTLKKISHTELRSHFKYALVGIGFDELDRESFDKQCFDRQTKDCVKILTTQYTLQKR